MRPTEKRRLAGLGLEKMMMQSFLQASPAEEVICLATTDLKEREVRLFRCLGVIVVKVVEGAACGAGGGGRARAGAGLLVARVAVEVAEPAATIGRPTRRALPAAKRRRRKNRQVM